VLIVAAVRPESGWLDGTNLTWFDVPGECNRIWNGGATNSPGCVDCAASCPDTDQMAGCVLGGGTAVNAGLWWKVGYSRMLRRVSADRPLAKSHRLGCKLPSRLEVN
jgi:hypothetical protein